MNVEKRFKKENISKIAPNVSYSDIAPFIQAKKSAKKGFWPKIFIPSAMAVTAGIAALAISMSGFVPEIEPALLNQETVSSQSTPAIINAIRTNDPLIQNAFFAARFSAIDFGEVAEDTSEVPTVIEEDAIEDLLIELDAMMANDDSYVISELVSDKEEYQYLQEIFYTDVDGSKSSYNLYYTEAVVVEDAQRNKTHISTTYSGIAVAGELQFDFDVLIDKEIKRNKEEVVSLFTLHESETAYTIIEVNETAKKNKEDTAYICTRVENGVETKYSLKLGAKHNGNKTLILNYNGQNYTVISKVAGAQNCIEIQINDEETITYVKTVDENGIVTYEKQIGDDLN